MQNTGFTRLLLVTLGLFFASGVQCQGPVQLNVTVHCEQLPSAITINAEHGSQPRMLERSSVNSTYPAVFHGDLPINNSSSQLATPYRLVGEWEHDKEQIYLGVKPGSSNAISLTMYHSMYPDDTYRELDKIDSLSTDYDSILQKYFRSRAFHKTWRYKLQRPKHTYTLRSARIWYDAAYNLAALNSMYQMDPEIVTIVSEYEKMKETDPTFKKRWEKYAKPGYIATMNNQFPAMDYRFVNKIPHLISEGRLEEAALLNTKALESLAGAEAGVVKAVSRFQGVNEAMLERNDKYISAMRKQTLQ